MSVLTFSTEKEDSGSDNGASDEGSSTGGERNVTCAAGVSEGEVCGGVAAAVLCPMLDLIERRP